MRNPVKVTKIVLPIFFVTGILTIVIVFVMNSKYIYYYNYIQIFSDILLGKVLPFFKIG